MTTKPKYTFEQLSVLVATIAHKWDYTLDYHSSNDRYVTFRLPVDETATPFFLREIESTLGVSVLIKAEDNHLLIIIANY